MRIHRFQMESSIGPRDFGSGAIDRRHQRRPRIVVVLHLSRQGLRLQRMTDLHARGAAGRENLFPYERFIRLAADRFDDAPEQSVAEV